MEIKMAKSKVEKRGRILIPKKIREEFNIRGGEEMKVRSEGDKIIIEPSKSMDKLKELEGCIKESKIDPLDPKKMWEM